jgi:hypothetical protein
MLDEFGDSTVIKTNIPKNKRSSKRDLKISSKRDLIISGENGLKGSRLATF